MKKKSLKFIAVLAIVVLAIGNGTIVGNFDSKGITLKQIVKIGTAQAEWGGGGGRWYITSITPTSVTCYNDGCYCCPGWDC